MSKKTARALVSGHRDPERARRCCWYTTGREGATYYKHVDEVMVAPEQWYGKKMQLHGFVVDGSI